MYMNSEFRIIKKICIEFRTKIIYGKIVEDFHETGPNILSYTKSVIFNKKNMKEDMNCLRNEILNDFYNINISDTENEVKSKEDNKKSDKKVANNYRLLLEDSDFSATKSRSSSSSSSSISTVFPSFALSC